MDTTNVTMLWHLKKAMGLNNKTVSTTFQWMKHFENMAIRVPAAQKCRITTRLWAVPRKCQHHSMGAVNLFNGFDRSLCHNKCEGYRLYKRHITRRNVQNI